MAVVPVNLTRVSFQQQANSLREALRATQTNMYRLQSQLSTGLRFGQPSEDPLAAAAVAGLDRKLERLQQAGQNLSVANAVLGEADTAAAEAIDLLNEAQALALGMVSDTTDPEDRAAMAVVVDSLLERLVAVGNRRHLNTYLFSGRENRAPFELSLGGVLYTGDGNRRGTTVDAELNTDEFTIPGLELFGAVSARVSGVVDLNPAVTLQTRISDLRGSTGRGVMLGRIVVTAGEEQVEIDLRGADTVGDLLDRLNAGLPEGMSATLGERGIGLDVGDATLADLGGGRTLSDLGWGGADRGVIDLDPRLTLWTPMSALDGGRGLDLDSTFVIRNGMQSATIDLSGAETVEDALNLINGAGIGVWARIADDGRSLAILSRVSGVDLTIEEAGGLTATALGLRSLHVGTLVADLNGGLGIQTVEGADCRVTTSSGFTFEVDLDGVVTMQDVIDRFNAAGAGRIRAAFAVRGNGLLISDLTVGGGMLSIAALNSSPSVASLGLDVPATGRELRGRDVNPLRVDSPFTALLELRAGLAGNDRQTMQTAAQRLERVLQQVQRVHGQLAAQAEAMSRRAERVETETTAAQVLVSDLRDADPTEAIVRLQALQTALQANLAAAARVSRLSLLDYLR